MSYIKEKFLVPIIALPMLFMTLSCEDEIDPDLAASEPLVNIDAWINNKPEAQVVQITWTIDYDDNDQLPPAVPDCSVIITDDLGKEYIFVENKQKKDGTYVWIPGGPGESFGGVGRSFSLSVQLPSVIALNPKYNGQLFTATSFMADVPSVDDITYEVQESNAFNNSEEGFRAEFKSKDLLGIGNAYWIRTYKNGRYLNKASEINIAYDAGTSKDSGFDGVSFLPPIRAGINPSEVDENDDPLPPYEVGDSIYVEIHSISESAFNYLGQIIANTNRQTGLGSIFSSTPLSNSSTNILSNGPIVVGFFNTASVKGYGKMIK
jgi:hypothetical protein